MAGQYPGGQDATKPKANRCQCGRDATCSEHATQSKRSSSREPQVEGCIPGKKLTYRQPSQQRAGWICHPVWKSANDGTPLRRYGFKNGN